MDKLILKNLNSQGFIVGPQEDLKQFENRISTIKSGSIFEELMDGKLTRSIEVESKLFGYRVDWIQCFSRRALVNIWEPAKTWIYSHNDIYIPLLQMPNKQKRVSKAEVIEHESVHAVRCAFPSSKFEEHFAYLTSPKRFRKFLGPLFEKPYEALVLLILSFLPLVCSIAFLEQQILSFVPFVFFLLLLFTRLFINRRVLKNCFSSISQLFLTAISPEAIALRLTDKEIKLFSQKDTVKIHTYISKQHSLRWEQILASYTYHNKFQNNIDSV